MNLFVLLAGVADPKWPLPRDLSPASLLAHRAQREVLSPFDEAALEIALKIRDADPSTQIHAVAVGGDVLARRVAGFRLDSVTRLDPAELPLWSAAELAGVLAAQCKNAQMVLTGREFGDQDDGTLPPLVAVRLSLPFVGLALSLTQAGGGLRIVRQGGDGLEQLEASAPVLVAVTNDSGNRLRQPLLKNVMAAKKMPLAAAPVPAIAGAVQLQSLQDAVPPVREQACRFLQGSAQEQAAALAEVLASLKEAA